MTSEFRTLADAVGEGHNHSPDFAPGIDFDPSDTDTIELIGDATARHRLEHEARTASENEELRRQVLELEAARAGLSVTDYLAELEHADRVTQNGH